ncbi:MAG: SigB/SigF/SigG family RNA polymerase sigma factor [Ilumatobacteraceae bacterium]
MATKPTQGPTDHHDLFVAYRTNPTRKGRNELVELHMGLAAHIARRLSRGSNDQDIRQVAMIGLVKAVDRFDPERGTPFAAFAGRTIEGEIKRHFRDRTWSVRVPRSAKELHLAVRRATDELQQILRRSPTVDEIASHLDVERDQVITGLAAGASYSTSSLDSTPSDDNVASDHRSVLATTDAGFEQSEHRDMVTELLHRLPERERMIVSMRFFEELSQTEIAERVGISQMHVSRLLRASFETMRAWARDES